MIKFFEKYKTHINNTILYSSSQILVKAIPFLLLPVFTKYLSKEDYGYLGLIMSILGFVSIYIGLKPSLFIIVKGSQLNKKNFSEYIFNLFILGIYSLIFVFIIMILLKKFFFNELSYTIIILIVILGYLRFFGEIVETTFIVDKNALHFFKMQLAKAISTAVLSLIMIILFKMGWKGKFYADVWVGVGVAVFSIFYLNKKHYITSVFSFYKQKELFFYLFPLTFHVVGLTMMSSIDRIFLSKIVGLEATGLYTVAYTIGALIGIIHEALLKVWSPVFYKRIKNANAEIKTKILKFMYLYIILSFGMYGVFILVSPIAFNLLVDDKFHSAYYIVPIIALGLTFESFRKLFIGYHYNLGKNNRIAMLTLSAGLINAILNYLLIPLYGISGAAYATLIAYIFVFVLTIIDVNKIENLNWRLR